jgi:hypothetical protein
MATKLILLPLAIIRQLARLIVQLAVPIHAVYLPVAVVQAAVLVVELAFAVAHVVDFFALVAGALFEVLDDEGGQLVGFLRQGVVQGF